MSLPEHRRERYRRALQAFNGSEGTATGVVDSIAAATLVSGQDFERASVALRHTLYAAPQGEVRVNRSTLEQALRNAFVAAGFKVQR